VGGGRAYFTSGTSALYLFVYAAYYLFTRVHIVKVHFPPPCSRRRGRGTLRRRGAQATIVSGALFFGYMFILSYAFFVLTGWRPRPDASCPPCGRAPACPRPMRTEAAAYLCPCGSG
jgi:hypothetical protein